MHPRPGGTDDSSDRAGPPRSGLASRRVLWSAFGLSMTIHILAVGLYPLIFEKISRDAQFFFPPVVNGPQGTPVIRLVELDETRNLDSPEDPDEIEELEDPAVEAVGPVLEGLPGIVVAPSGPSAADRLRPRLGDARLWRPPPAAFFELSLEQREELIIASRLNEWLDSVRVSQAAEDALTDWTFTDRDGGRWGISPGQIHLGDITLPLPINFGTSVGKRDETNRLVWQWEEIMRQAARSEVEMSWRERSEAIRVRRDAERAAAAPDTTRGR